MKISERDSEEMSLKQGDQGTDMQESNVGGISVIIPIYNGEHFIDCCMESILTQTYTDLEILLIDDGSTDSSAEMCDKYAMEDARIQVFHKKNGGVSSARNLGLEAAAKDYVAFVDVDDLLDRRYFEVLMNDALMFQSDIVCCGVHEILENYDGRETGRLRTVETKRQIDCFDDYFDKWFDEWFYGTIVWGRIIKRQLAIKERFSSLRYGEDTEYMMRLFSHSPRTYLDEYMGYYYIRWPSSTTGKMGDVCVEGMENAVEVKRVALDLCIQYKNDSLICKAYQKYAVAVYGLLSCYIKNGDYILYRSNQKKIEEMICVLDGREIGRKHRLAFGLYSLSDVMYWYLFKMLISAKERLA